METATLGEFSTRLDIVTAFLAEVNLKGNFLLLGWHLLLVFDVFSFHNCIAGASCTGHCLGNVVMYYRQFSVKVEQAIQQLITPVEKQFNVRDCFVVQHSTIFNGNY